MLDPLGLAVGVGTGTPPFLLVEPGLLPGIGGVLPGLAGAVPLPFEEEVEPDFPF